MNGNIEEEVSQMQNLEFHKGERKRCSLHNEHQKLTGMNIHGFLATAYKSRKKLELDC